MKRIKTYILLVWAMLFATVVLSGCMEESLVQTTAQLATNGVSYNADGTMNVSVEMKIPDMTLAQTRAMGDENLQALGIYMLVFEEGEGLKQFAKLSAKETVEDDTHTGNTLVKFSAKLEPTEKNAVVHLIATDQPEFATQVSYGTEERVITSLYTDDNHEAYWQRINLGCNIPSKEQATEVEGKKDEYSEEEAEKAADIKEKLTHIPMVRNFCKVTAETSGNITYDAKGEYSNFEITGLYVLNTVDRGTVAPYLASYSETDRFLRFYKEEGGKYVGRDYRDITDNTKYQGAMPVGVKLINKLGEDIQTKSEDSNGNIGAVYFYERPARTNSTERTYVVIRAEYTKNGTPTVGFYKLDLGHIDDEDQIEKPKGDMVGLFEYYNLLRNFHYRIIINSVEGDGYSSLSEAAKGPVFNNMSASVEAKNMSSISDGDDWIYVSRTSYVFTTENETLELLAQFRVDVGTEKEGIDNNLLKYAYEKDGSVIKSVGETINRDNSPNAYNTYSITSFEPTDELQRQEFYVYRGNKAVQGAAPDYGLYRIVTLFLHKPWQFRHIDTFPGLWESMDDMPSWDWSDEYREIGQSKGAPLTLFFELPPDLPQAIFPLEFVIESDRQNIQNAYVGNAVVRSVPAKESLFATDPTIGTPTTSRIQYVKTVTWEDYYGEWNDAELIGHGSSVVRCRFLTITDLAQDNVGGSGSTGKSTTNLRVYNPYFGSYKYKKDENGKETEEKIWVTYTQDGFERNTDTSDPSPRSWDFSSAYWDQVMLEMNDIDSREKYERDKNNTDELMFVENSKGNLSNGTDDDVVRYVQASTGGILTHKHTYSTGQKRTIRLEVTSTDGDGTPAPPTIAFTEVKGGTMTAPTAPKATLDAEGGKKIYVYEIDVPAAVTSLYVDIKPSTSPMRFYKIDFYPRWDEYVTTNP